MINKGDHDIWIIDPHGRIPGENMGHLIGINLAYHFAKKGNKVLYISSTFSHILKKQRADKTTTMNIDGLDIVLLKANKYEKHIGLKRIVWHLYFAYSFLKHYKKWGKPNYISVSFPLPFFDLLIPYIKKRTGSKVVIQFRDLWPEIFETILPKYIKPFGKYIFSPFFLMRNIAFSSCDGITSVSKRYNNIIADINDSIRDKKRAVIYNSNVSITDFESIDSSSYSIFSDHKKKIILNYSGTLGEGYDIDGLLSVMERFKNSQYSENLKLYISGKGPMEDYVIAKSKELGSKYIEFMGVLPYDQLLALYKITDIGCLPYIRGTTVDFPAKVFDYIVSGTPIVHSIDGELRELTESNQCGIYYEAENNNELYNSIESLLVNKKNQLTTMEENMKLISSQYTAEKTLREFSDFYEKIMQ